MIRPVLASAICIPNSPASSVQCSLMQWNAMRCDTILQRTLQRTSFLLSTVYLSLTGGLPYCKVNDTFAYAAMILP